MTLSGSILPRKRRQIFAIFLCTGAALLTSGCESHLRLNPDFGNAVYQDQAAQIADPNAHYLGYPPPGYDGARTALAEKRYQTGKVIRPTVSSTSGFAGYAPSESLGSSDQAASAPPPQM